MPANLQVQGLHPLIAELKGPMFRQINNELRAEAMEIAEDLRPGIAAAVRRSAAPQAGKVAHTTRVGRDRIPVVSIGKTQPKLSGLTSRKRRKREKPGGDFIGSDPKRNRGSIAHGVVYGPLGGHRATTRHENYYRIARDNTGGPVGRALREGGHLFNEACEAYLKAFQHVLRRHGFLGDPPSWKG